MDFLSIEPDSKNKKDILVVTDHFTKYAMAIPTRDQKASTVAKSLWENINNSVADKNKRRFDKVICESTLDIPIHTYGSGRNSSGFSVVKDVTQYIL